MDLIRIRGLEIDCVVGVRPLEREREQRVHLDIAMGMDLSRAGRTGRITQTCNYDETADTIIAMLKFRRFHLIEMATEELAAMLLGVHPALELVDIRLDKPAALDGRARAASVEVQRTPAQFPRALQTTAFGSVETLLETRDAVLQLLRIEAGREAKPSHPEGTRILEWLVAGELDRDGLLMSRHLPVVGERDEPTYVSTGMESAVLFRCICPTSEH
jgi:7,8-dihydroneopterin aldolase/epimerase/oxygenase